MFTLSALTQMSARTAFAVIASTGCLLLAAKPAMADTVKLNVASHELKTAEGRATLDKRIALAARQACGAHQDTRNIARMRVVRECIAEATGKAAVDMAALSFGQTELAAR